MNADERCAMTAYDREMERRRKLHATIVRQPSKEYRIPGAVSTNPPEGLAPEGRTMSPQRWAEQNRVR